MKPSSRKSFKKTETPVLNREDQLRYELNRKPPEERPEFLANMNSRDRILTLKGMTPEEREAVKAGKATPAEELKQASAKALKTPTWKTNLTFNPYGIKQAPPQHGSATVTAVKKEMEGDY